MMSTDDKQMVQEHIKLQKDFIDYVKMHGFDYAEYCAAPPGSFYESYRKRWLEITHAIAPSLHPDG